MKVNILFGEPGIQLVVSYIFYTYLSSQDNKNHSCIFILSSWGSHVRVHTHSSINVCIWNINFLKRKSFSKSGRQSLDSESDSRYENNEEFLHSTNVSWIPATRWAPSQGLGRLRVPGAHTESGTTELKVAGQARVRADTQKHILIQPQTFATTVPQQINTTATQVQDEHDKKARGPSRDAQAQYSSHSQRANQGFWTTNTKAVLSIYANPVGPYCGANEMFVLKN